MIIAIIVAMSEKRGIGKGGELPWRLSTDLRRFKALTMGHYLILGRKTFESLPRSLPGRKIILLTRNPEYPTAGVLIANSLESAVAMASADGETELFVGGGAQIYAPALRIADRIYLTLVHAEVEADVFFPDYDESQWVEKWSEYHPAGDRDQYPFTFKVLERAGGTPEANGSPITE